MTSKETRERPRIVNGVQIMFFDDEGKPSSSPVVLD